MPAAATPYTHVVLDASALRCMLTPVDRLSSGLRIPRDGRKASFRRIFARNFRYGSGASGIWSGRGTIDETTASPEPLLVMGGGCEALFRYDEAIGLYKRARKPMKTAIRTTGSTSGSV